MTAKRRKKPKRKPGSGRPPLPVELRRGVELRVRLTPAEHATVLAAAKASRLTIADWVRTCIGVPVVGQ